MTLRRQGTGSESLILIGGFSPRHGFLNSVWEFNLEAENWTELATTGNGPLGNKFDRFVDYLELLFSSNHSHISPKLLNI